MTAPRLRRTLALAAAAAVAAAAAALAQTAAAPSGDYGGGALAVPVSEKTVAKDMLLSIRPLGGGRIGVAGHLYARCGLGTIAGDAQLAADGTFTLRGDTTRRPLVGVRHTTTFVVRGRLMADGGEGTASLRLRVRAKRRATRTCKSRTVRWVVRRAPDAAAAPAPAPAETTLYGLTAQDGPRARRAIVLHATRAGRSIDRLVFGFRLSCERGRVLVSDDLNFTPEFDVAASGSFREVERFKRTFSDVIVRTTIVVRGQFDAAGGAAGRLAVTERHTRRRSGKRVDECATGTRTWWARP